MKLVDREKYQAWKDKQADGYGLTCFAFAEQWAELMEEWMDGGKTIPEMAELASSIVDNRPGFGITGFMHGMAVAILSECWIHGEELRKWHNRDTQLHDEGDKANEEPDAVLNPALIKIS